MKNCAIENMKEKMKYNIMKFNEGQTGTKPMNLQLLIGKEMLIHIFSYLVYVLKL